MKILYKAVAGATAFISLISGQAAHADVTCLLDLYQINVTPDGMVNLNITTATSSRSWWLCSLVGSMENINDGYGIRTISSEACRSLYTHLLTIKASGRPAYFAYHGPTDCSDASLPAPGFMSLYPFFIGIR